MLMGEYHNNLDLKNRLVIPNKFREEIKHELILTRGLDGSLFGFSKETFYELTNKLNNLSLTDKTSRNFMRFFLSSAVTLEYDKQGRITIPNYLLKHALLEKEVIVIGVSNRIEIWSLEKWNSFITDNFDSLSNISNNLFNSN